MTHKTDEITSHLRKEIARHVGWQVEDGIYVIAEADNRDIAIAVLVNVEVKHNKEARSAMLRVDIDSSIAGINIEEIAKEAARRIIGWSKQFANQMGG